MFMLQEDGYPKVFNYKATCTIPSPVFNQAGQIELGSDGKPVTLNKEQELFFVTQEECDKVIHENPQISFKVETLMVGDIKWIEKYQFSSELDVKKALAAKDSWGDGCNMFFFEKDGLLKAIGILLLKSAGIAVSDTCYAQATLRLSNIDYSRHDS